MQKLISSIVGNNTRSSRAKMADEAPKAELGFEDS